jgi:DNA polymerase III subunit beta
MQVIVTKKDFSRILDRCQGVADKKGTMPVLGNVLVEVASPSQLRLAATDLFLAVSGVIPAEVDKGGSIAVGARDLFERVRMMPEGQLSLTVTEGSALSLRAVGTARRFTIHGLPGSEFPQLPKPEAGASQLMLPVGTLSSLIQSTQFSISTDDSRLALNSALIEHENGRLRMVTTDGHRLTKAEAELPKGGDAHTLLVPLKGIQQLKRICDDALAEATRTDDSSKGEPVLEMLRQGPNAFFRTGTLEFSVKLVDAQFPPYEQVIPNTSERVIRAPRLGVAEALKAVSVAASDRTGGVKLTLTRDTLRFETESPESGEGFDEVGIEYDGPDITIGFNARYFLDIANAIPDDELLLGLGGELDPAVVRPASSSQAFDFLAVVMPMRI